MYQAKNPGGFACLYTPSYIFGTTIKLQKRKQETRNKLSASYYAFSWIGWHKCGQSSLGNFLRVLQVIGGGGGCFVIRCTWKQKLTSKSAHDIIFMCSRFKTKMVFSRDHLSR